MKNELKVMIKRVLVMTMVMMVLVYTQKELVPAFQNWAFAFPHSHNIDYSENFFREIHEMRFLVRVLSHIFSIPAYYWLLTRAKMVVNTMVKVMTLIEGGE